MLPVLSTTTQEAQNCRNVSFLFEYVGVRTKSPKKQVPTRIAGFGRGTPYETSFSTATREG